MLAAGLGLRVVTQVAYRPALFYIDSYKYLTGSGGSDPVGYNILLKPILWLGNLAVVAGFQHLLGLAMGVIIYALLIRRGAALLVFKAARSDGVGPWIWLDWGTHA